MQCLFEKTENKLKEAGNGRLKDCLSWLQSLKQKLLQILKPSYWWVRSLIDQSERCLHLFKLDMPMVRLGNGKLD